MVVEVYFQVEYQVLVDLLFLIVDIDQGVDCQFFDENFVYCVYWYEYRWLW